VKRECDTNLCAFCFCFVCNQKRKRGKPKSPMSEQNSAERTVAIKEKAKKNATSALKGNKKGTAGNQATVEGDNTGGDGKSHQEQEVRESGVAEAPPKVTRKRAVETNSEVAKYTKKGTISGYEGRKFAVEGFGCIHCSLRQLKEHKIELKSYFDYYKKPGGLLHGSYCRGGCGKSGESLHMKDKRNGNEVAYYCNISVNENIKGDLPFCPWWCGVCFNRDLEIERRKYAEEQGEDPDKDKRSTRSRG
jgi:hypothetical protein